MNFFIRALYPIDKNYSPQGRRNTCEISYNVPSENRRKCNEWLGPCEQVNFEELKPAVSEEEFALHLAAVEWSLAESIVIANKDDIKSKVKWKDGFDPYHHQVQT